MAIGVAACAGAYRCLATLQRGVGAQAGIAAETFPAARPREIEDARALLDRKRRNASRDLEDV
jgi:hypothetical protein